MKTLITGATNGMGKGVAQALLARDDHIHEVIILGRSQARGAQTVQELQTLTGNPKVSFVHCDLRRLADVREALRAMRAQHEYLDGIFINAGLGYAARREETVDGMDPHFQVNYLSQFMLTLNLLDLLERSERGGRVIFNVTEGGHIFWDDLQMKKKWSYEDGVHQAMVAKRMFYTRLHQLWTMSHRTKLSFYGFQIPKTVWSNQINIIPTSMRVMATLVKWFGGFISIEECGEIIAPLFTENQETSQERSGKFIIRNKEGFIEKVEDPSVLDRALQEQLWKTSIELCRDDETRQRADALGPEFRLGRVPMEAGVDVDRERPRR